MSLKTSEITGYFYISQNVNHAKALFDFNQSIKQGQYTPNETPTAKIGPPGASESNELLVSELIGSP
jgi:hypothetical protein